MRTWTARLAAGALAGLAVLAACEASSLTGPETNPPFIRVLRPDSGLVVSPSRPLVLRVRAGDDVSLLSVADTVYLDSDSLTSTGTRVRYRTVLSEKYVKFTSETKAYSDSLTISLSDAKPGDTVRVVGFALDGNKQGAADALVLPVGKRLPDIRIDSLADWPVRIGSPIKVTATFTDSSSALTFGVASAFSVRGDPTFKSDTIQIYHPDTASLKGTLGTYVAHFQISQAVAPTPEDSVLHVVVSGYDKAGNFSKVDTVIHLVSGPALTLTGDKYTVLQGDTVRVTVRGVDPDGIDQLGYLVLTSPTPFVPTQQLASFTMHPGDTTATFVVPVPTTIASGTRFVLRPQGRDATKQPGSGPDVAFTVLGVSTTTDTLPPIVRQTVASRVELADSVTIYAFDSTGVASIGFTVTDTLGNVIKTYTYTLPTALRQISMAVPLGLPSTYLGKPVVIYSFATDVASPPHTGYSTTAGALVPATSLAGAKTDTLLLAYGSTTLLPAGTVVGDLAVDTTGTKVYVSDMLNNRLGVWNSSTGAITYVPVGAQPWGLAVGRTGDTLFVANSGGTNISMVSLTSGSEVRRLKTANTVTYDLSISIASGVYHYVLIRTDYSDRPQYIAQSANGNIFFSTRPTASASPGTLRFFDPTAGEVKQIFRYGDAAATGHIGLFNVDSGGITPGPTPGSSDLITLCSHSYGNYLNRFCFTSIDYLAVLDSLRARNGVVESAPIDPASLALTDTTFVAAGPDHRWVAFGEGNTSGPGRVMMARDTLGTPQNAQLMSPGILVTDLVNNASDRVFGLALTKGDSILGIHGSQSIFAAVEDPFHLRLQGTYQSYGAGAGIAFHPDNLGGAGSSLNDLSRVVFVASNNNTIEIIDSYYYKLRGLIPVKTNLRGPLRVSHRFPSDPADVILKLFGLTDAGLTVIDIRATDILPVQ